MLDALRRRDLKSEKENTDVNDKNSMSSLGSYHKDLTSLLFCGQIILILQGISLKTR